MGYFVMFHLFVIGVFGCRSQFSRKSLRLSLYSMNDKGPSIAARAFMPVLRSPPKPTAVLTLAGAALLAMKIMAVSRAIADRLPYTL